MSIPCKKLNCLDENLVPPLHMPLEEIVQGVVLAALVGDNNLPLAAVKQIMLMI
jgi:hypothetical protein